MIENPKPLDWKELQRGVCRILNEVGINASLEQSLDTPRGTVEVDVYGIDENSVEKIKYIIECKNWGKPVPQHVIHSFTTVLHETGGHIGILISKEGFQAGALKYIQSTNIVALSFDEFQKRYFKQWYVKSFCKQISSGIDCLLQYVEPINSKRSKHLALLSDTKRAEYDALSSQYEMFAIIMAMLNLDKFAQGHEPLATFDINDFKAKLVSNFGEEFQYQSLYYRDLANEITKHAQEITLKFHSVFGRNIFA